MTRQAKLRENLREKLSLYLVTDERQDMKGLLDIVHDALMGGVRTVQLRRKHDDGRAMCALGRELRRLTLEFDAYYIVNDRIDVALLTDADGVHLGQSDITCEDARQLLGLEPLIGISACTLEEALAAERACADYLGVGAIFETPSKTDADISGLDGLREIAKQISIPVIAIGGVHQHNAKDVITAGADGFAVVSAIMQAEDPRIASARLKSFMTR